MADTEFTLEALGPLAVEPPAGAAAAQSATVIEDDYDADTRIGFTLTDNERAEGGLAVLEGQPDDVVDTQSDDASAHAADTAHDVHEVVEAAHAPD